MKLGELMRGIEILRPHYTDPDGYHMGCEHDQFYMYQTDTQLSEAEAAEMFKLGWFQEGGEENVYTTDDGWSAFV